MLQKLVCQLVKLIVGKEFALVLINVNAIEDMHNLEIGVLVFLYVICKMKNKNFRFPIENFPILFPCREKCVKPAICDLSEIKENMQFDILRNLSPGVNCVS